MNPEAAQPSGAIATAPLSVVIRYPVQPGLEGGFEKWLSSAVKAAAGFPGHQGATVLRPSDHAHPEYVLIYRFATYEDLRRWNDSFERQALVSELDELTRGKGTLTQEPGLETWFTLPGAKSIPPIPRWKMAVLTLLGIYPLALGIPMLLPAPVAQLPTPVRTLVVAAIMIWTMTWVVMPQITRLFQGWIAGAQKEDGPQLPGGATTR